MSNYRGVIIHNTLQLDNRTHSIFTKKSYLQVCWSKDAREADDKRNVNNRAVFVVVFKYSSLTRISSSLLYHSTMILKLKVAYWKCEVLATLEVALWNIVLASIPHFSFELVSLQYSQSMCEEGNWVDYLNRPAMHNRLNWKRIPSSIEPIVQCLHS